MRNWLYVTTMLLLPLPALAQFSGGGAAGAGGQTGPAGPVGPTGPAGPAGAAGAAGPSNLNAIPPGTAPPTSGTYLIGQFEQNTAPTVQGSAGAQYIILGWTCITAGSPGTWKPLNILIGS